MLEFWQNLPAQIDPLVFSGGGFGLHWYSVGYLLALATVYFLLTYRIKKEEDKFSKINKNNLLDLLSFLFLGAILGGRLGYVFFYDLAYFWQNPLEIFWPFVEGEFVGISGMSFHGGLIGAIVAGLIFARKNKVNFLNLADFILPAFPLGYFWGRLGNFLGGELFGRPTDCALGMYFPTDNLHQLRHPSQLYEALGEGILLFAIFWPLRNQKKLERKMLPLFLIGYASMRFLIEFFRQADSHLGLLWLNLSLGQWLCLAMLTVGLILLNLIKQDENSSY